MRSHMNVGQAENVSPLALLKRESAWISLGWGLCVVLLLGFSPRLFHIQEYLFFVLLGLGFLLCLWDGTSLLVRNPVILPFVCYVSWIALTLPFSINSWTSLEEWQKVLAQLAVFYGTCLIVRKQHHEQFRRIVLVVIGIGTICCCSYSLWDFWDRGGNFLDRTVRAGFPLADGADFTWLSTNVLMVLPVLAAGLVVQQSARWRVFLGAALTFAFFGLVFSYTRGVWLAFLVQVSLAVWLLNKKVSFYLLGIGVVVFSLLLVLVTTGGLHRDTLDTWTMKARLTVWGISLSDIWAHPLVGIGYGVPIFEQRHAEHIAQLEAITKDIPDIPEKPHNWYLMVAMGSGLPGLFLLLWLLRRVWRSLYSGFLQADTTTQQFWFLGTLLMAGGFFIRLVFDDSFGGSHSYLFWILAGLMLANSIEQTRSRPLTRWG